MGKTPKKPAPGGDESNLYVRRLKATTTASLNACDTNLSGRQRETENPNRGKELGAQKRIPVPPGKVFKSKLRIPATTKSHRAMKNPPRFQPSTSKEEKKTSGPSTTSKDRETTQIATMQSESEEAAVQLRVSITKKDVKEGSQRISVSGESSAKDEKQPSQDDRPNSNGKDVMEITETENTTPRVEVAKEENNATTEKNSTGDKEKLSQERATIETVNESTDSTKKNSKNDESEFNDRSSELDENSLKLEDEEVAPKSSPHIDTHQEIPKNVEEEKNSEDIKESLQETEVKKLTEKCSVDVVESTTSEASDSGNATQESTGNRNKNDPENDASFISYDSSIMLKDVQIKLNDCLKDNSKLFDVSNANDESNVGDEAEQQKRLDMSFGKTLRSISGRSTINRLKYVTVREHRFSPNSSLFVNTSSASIDPEDSASFNLSRYPSEFSTNGTLADRKRKIVTESVASVKKLKTETPERTSIFNTSLEILKSIRRPVEVSTPKAKGYNFSTDKYSDKSLGDDKLTVDTELEPKKWCVVM